MTTDQEHADVLRRYVARTDEMRAAIERAIEKLEREARIKAAVERDRPLLDRLAENPVGPEHQCRYPQPNGQGFPVNQCLDCGGWIIAGVDDFPAPEMPSEY